MKAWIVLVLMSNAPPSILPINFVSQEACIEWSLEYVYGKVDSPQLNRITRSPIEFLKDKHDQMVQGKSVGYGGDQSLRCMEAPLAIIVPWPEKTP